MSSDSSLVGALFLVGMAVPVIISWLAQDVLSLYLSVSQFTYAAAVAFGLTAWAFQEVVDPDRLTVIMWALVFPWVFSFGLVLLAIWTDLSAILGYLLRDIGGLATYAGSFMIAAIASVVIRERVRLVSRQYRYVPRGRTIAFGVLIVTVIAILLGGGVLTVSAMSASVSDVEPGVIDYQTAVLNVTVEDPRTEMRLRVTGPEGNMHIRRVTPAANGDARITVPVSFYGDLASAPKPGTYHIEITAISGVTVDTTTYTVDDGPSPTVLDVETAGPGEPMRFDISEYATVYRPSRGPTDPDTRIAVILENSGDVAGDFDTVVHLTPDLVDGREIFVEPGQKGANVIAIDDRYVERLHEESNGTVTVEIVYEETHISRVVRLPEP